MLRENSVRSYAAVVQLTASVGFAASLDAIVSVAEPVSLTAVAVTVTVNVAELSYARVAVAGETVTAALSDVKPVIARSGAPLLVTVKVSVFA